MDFFTSPYFLLFARLCVGGVFIVSGLGKWVDKPGTEAGMSKYLFLPKGSGRFIANVVPPRERAIGLALVFGLLTRLAAVGAFLLVILFTGLIIYDLSRGKDQSCHCFGKLSDDKLTPMSVVRNVFLMALSALLFLAFDGWMALDSALYNGGTGWQWLVAKPTTQAIVPGSDTATVVPIAFLSLFTVMVIVFGGRAVSMVRNTLNGLGFR
jgi:uncharacterized membrane protein YphA (DoxX/SURF4 family)